MIGARLWRGVQIIGQKLDLMSKKVSTIFALKMEVVELWQYVRRSGMEEYVRVVQDMFDNSEVFGGVQLEGQMGIPYGHTGAPSCFVFFVHFSSEDEERLCASLIAPCVFSFSSFVFFSKSEGNSSSTVEDEVQPLSTLSCPHQVGTWYKGNGLFRLESLSKLQ